MILQLYEKSRVPVDWNNRVNHPPFLGAGGGHLKKVGSQTAFLTEAMQETLGKLLLENMFEHDLSAANKVN